MHYTIGLVHGDGIGPEIVESGVQVLNKAAHAYGFTLDYVDLPAGGRAIDAYGHPLPADTVEKALQTDSVLLGAVGGPKWDTLPGNMRPERGLLDLRAAMGLFSNIRPAVLFPALKDACPLRTDIAAQGFDLVVVRELTGGIYFGEKGRREGRYGPEAYDTECYSTMEIERIGRVAFDMARKRRGKLTSIDKANVLESSRLWRETMHLLTEQYPDIAFSDMLVDNAAMQLVRNPGQFDVVVTSNMFGDILSDEASMLTGSIGLLPSASLGEGTRGLYEPIHGSAPDIAGKGIANPLATILSCAMMLRYSLNQPAAAKAVEKAVEDVVNQGLRTADLHGTGTPLNTRQMTHEVVKRL